MSMSDASLQASILVVDDERGVRDLMSRWLVGGGYDVATAESADEALHRVEDAPPAVALCDIRMPGRDGLWLAEQIRRTAPETAVIMATGVHDVTSAVTSLRQGVIDYLTKPFGRDRLRESVLRGLDWHKTAMDARRWRETLETELRTRADVLQRTLDQHRIDSDAALDTALVALTAHNSEAYAHAYRVAAMAVSVGRALHLSDEQVSTIEHAALLHDLGKLAVPDAVLRKPAPLSDDEQAVLRRHPDIGAELVASVPYLASSADIVRHVHERPDSLGYPDGCPGAEVPIGSRIIAVADAFDAMTRPRVFRDVIAPREALLEIARCAGTQFDSMVVHAFARVMQF
jgi:response regulator RpfG family c-di-GMP phosphodiesterase